MMARVLPGTRPAHKRIGLAGSGGGLVHVVQTDARPEYGRIVLGLVGYLSGAQAQAVPLPAPFASYGIVVQNTTGLAVTVANDAVTLPANVTTPATGIIVLEGE